MSGRVYASIKVESAPFSSRARNTIGESGIPLRSLRLSWLSTNFASALCCNGLCSRGSHAELFAARDELTTLVSVIRCEWGENVVEWEVGLLWDGLEWPRGGRRAYCYGVRIDRSCMAMLVYSMCFT